MSRDLIAQLKQLKQKEDVLNADPVWVTENRKALRRHVLETATRDTKAAQGNTWQHIFNTLFPRRVLLTLRNSSIAVLVAMTAFGTFSGVNAAQKSKPGQVLYPVKLASEGVQISAAKLAGKKEVAVQLSLDFAKRRVDEAKQVSHEPEVLNKTVERLKKNLDSINMQLDEIKVEAVAERETAEKNEEAIALAKEVTERVDILAEDLADVKEVVGQDESVTKVFADVEEAANDTSLDALDVVIELDEEQETAKALVKQKIEDIAEKQAKEKEAQEDIFADKKDIDAETLEEEIVLPSVQATGTVSTTVTGTVDVASTTEIEPVVSSTVEEDQSSSAVDGADSSDLNTEVEEDKKLESEAIEEKTEELSTPVGLRQLNAEEEAIILQEETLKKIAEKVDASLKEAAALVEERPEEAAALLKEIHGLQSGKVLLEDVEDLSTSADTVRDSSEVNADNIAAETEAVEEN